LCRRTRFLVAWWAPRRFGVGCRAPPAADPKSVRRHDGRPTLLNHRFRHEEPSLADIDYLEDRLYEFNKDATGIADGRVLGIFLRDAGQVIVAAATGHTWGETCELRQVWVAESLRRRGVGRRLVAEAEAEAVRRKCRQIILTTHSFQAPEFYEKLGFTVVSEVPDYPKGHSQITLKKSLETGAV
jgi:ribosomal protein S18 acetylase RimI-like enzyme